MIRWTDLEHTPEELRSCVATLGNFDGVHKGHRAVLNQLLEVGRERGMPTVAITFEPHPVHALHPDRAPQLIAPGRLRDELLAQTGIDGLLVLPFTEHIHQQSAREFAQETFVDGLDAKVIVSGADSTFGSEHTGDVHELARIGEDLGFSVVVVNDLGEGERWSSSGVRAALASGDVAGASEILGRPHRVLGTVVHGHHRGRELGYPTANLCAETLGLVPAEGVYAGWMTRLDLPEDSVDRALPAAISIGTNPTFETRDRRTVEAYVLDRTDLDLYGEEVMVEFVEHIRPTLRFDSIEALMEAMAADVEQCRRILTQIVPS